MTHLPTRGRARAAVGLVASGALAVALLPALTSPVSAASTGANAAPAIASTPRGLAQAQARRTGRPVEVPDATTETTQVMAQPDGSFVLTSSLTPVRVRQNGAWRGIDTTLQRNSDGTVSPIASAAQVSFSGGGSMPAVTVAQGTASLSFTWPTALPTPTLSGSTATYSSVLPGVDLKLSASAGSYSEVLVVHNAAAAANPALHRLHFGVRSHGLKVSSDGNGGISARNQAGTELLHGSQPVMWDSSSDPELGPAPSATNPGTGRISPLAMSLPTADATAASQAVTTLTLVPPPARLAGPGVHYPVYIDPTLAPYRSHFAVVTTDGNWHYYDDTSNDLKVGYCNWSECGGSWHARTYLAFDVSDLTGKATTAHVYSAEVDAYEIHSAGDCTSERVDLYSAGAINSSTAWPGPIGSYLDYANSHLGNTCNNTAGNVVFNDSAVVSQFQADANSDTRTEYFALRSHDESDAYQWKRFSSAASGGAAAQIVVRYNFPPSVPYSLSLANTVKCSGLPTYTRDSTPTLYGAATDYNTPHINVALWFEIYNSADTTRYRYNPSGVVKASGDLAGWSSNGSNTNSTAALGDGSYDFRAHATAVASDTTDAAGGYSGWVPFTVDTTAPSVPVISSHDYPYNAWGTQQGGQVTLAGSSDTAGFSYSIDSSGTEVLPTDTTCSYTRTPTASGGMITANATTGDATITMPALTPGYHTLYAKAFDDAHNVSAQSSAWVFYVSPTYAGEGYTKHEMESLPQPTAQPGQTLPPMYLHDSTSYSAGTAVQVVANGPTSFTYQIVGAAGVPFEADYAVGIELQAYTHYAKMTFAIDGTPVELNGNLVTADSYSTTLKNLYVPLGGYHWLPGSAHTLTVNLIGASGTSYTYNTTYGRAANGYPVLDYTSSPRPDNGYTAVLDDVRVVPINNVTFASLKAAMNNDGITTDTGPAADISPSPSNRSFSQNALAAVGFGPGKVVTVDAGTADQATFTMPTYNADGSDNVISMGQSIPLPADTTANYVDLLVASSCGSTSYDPSIQTTVNFADGNYSQTQVPSVPDWAVGTLGAAPPGQEAHITVAATMDHSMRGTVVDTTYQPKIYHVSIPTKYTGSAVHSVTLPYLGSDLTERCSSPNLHVFSISTH